ncbi:hypothetical protein BCR33DRAFT_692021 [Rhizoclosmatium globosum]|uniref:L domain-like protein n=1 Tax=Rhizoclosmatium globosum TaxID=329046 RepID=A0A1Y1ZZG8_9FUNG|nr:hypothetical protein BCR33DRAFT_692021 [Rhizoclosmatium globosum]|eukprot:ORY15649.1 hypothetical protein BCR33DRAFT_692021 [Rhizoclosmatium globosum]
MYATVGIKMEFNNVPDLTWSSFKFLAAIRAFNGMQNLKTLSLVFAKPYKTYSHPSPAPRYGPLPANLRSMSIEKLTLDGFHGPLPRWDLPQLQIIISTNRIESQQLPLLSFPANLSEFNQVKYIDMVKFGLQGPIALGLCLSLQYLRLSKNHFNAGIPPDWTAYKLEVFDY